MTSRFVHLHVHSHYSLLDGLGKIPEMVARAKELGFDALALTDHGALYGAIEFYKACKAAGIKPILGAELYVAARSMRDKDSQLDDKRFHLTILAETNEGYRNLIQLISKAHLEGFYYKPRVDKTLLTQHATGLIALSGCLSGEIPRALQAHNAKRAEELLAEYLDIFGKDNFFLELGAHPNLPEQLEVNTALAELGKKHGVGLAGVNDIHYIRKEDAAAQDILVSVQTGARFEDENRLSMRQEDFSMKSHEEMAEFFKDIPEAVENTAAIAARCNVTLSLGAHQLPSFPVPAGFSAERYLRELCLAGIERRYGLRTSESAETHAAGNSGDDRRAKIFERLEYELSVITKTGFAPYFLIVQDFVNWAKQQGIAVGPGRGSAAGSLVSYVLNITNIDPLKYDLLFERFLNPERISMPDIDLDFADHRRDEVLDYVKKKYGEDRVAQIITFGTMAARAAVRDVTRAMGYPYSTGDHIAKLIPFGLTLEEALAASKELADAYASDDDVAKIIDTAKKLEGVARHASTHACGVVITKDPLTAHVPLQYASQAEQTIVTQYEMHAVEDLGLLKMDFLGLRNLTIIEETLTQAQHAYGDDIRLDELPLTDQKTFKLLQRGDTTGVFQLESSGMRRYLQELKPTEIEDIISMVALYRPGPMEYIPTYIRRKHGKERPAYLHEKLEPILKNTYGIGVYQEQMMQIARDLAGYSLPEADTLRKAIGKKIQSLLEQQREKLIAGMRKNGLDQRTAEAVWELFPPFARYGFPRAHATSYAMIAYQTAYLKAHYPFEFMTALLNAEGGTVERLTVLIGEAKRHKIPVLPPDVNTCGATFSVEYDAPSIVPHPQTIRFGLTAVKNVGTNVVEEIVRERERKGPFQNLEDFLMRLDPSVLNKKSIESMAASGALDALGERKAIIENMDELLRFARAMHKARQSSQGNLFAGTPVAYAKLRFRNVAPASKQERLAWEKELLGLYLSDHPLNEYKDLLSRLTLPIQELGARASGQRVKIGGIVNAIKKIITRSGDPMLFLDMEDLSDRVEVLVFPRVLERSNALAFRENAILLVEGTLNNRDGEMKVLCERVEEITTP